MKAFKSFLKNKLVLTLIILLIGSSSAHPFLFGSKELELKRAKRHKLLVNKYKYLYLKSGIFYLPPEANRGSVDLLE